MAENGRVRHESCPVVFIGGFAREMTPWDSVTISGFLSGNPKYLGFTFYKESLDKNLVMFFRFSVYIAERITSRVCMLNKGQEREEIKQNIINPINWHELSAHKEISVVFAAGEKRVYIGINEVAYCTFSFCEDLLNVQAVEVRGDMPKVKNFDHRTIFPMIWPKLHVVNARDQFTCDIPVTFIPGQVIALSAIPEGSSRGQFIIYFTDGASKKEVFHFNARFKPHYVVVRNAMNPKFELQNEDRTGGFPFEFETKFRIAFGFSKSSFHVAVNGLHFTSFKYIDDNLLDRMSGLKMKTRRGMEMHVLSVEHFYLPDSQCEGYEEFSRLLS